jgi:hypothetical protein
MVKKISTMISFDRACRIGPISIRAPISATPAMDMKKEMINWTLKRTTKEYINIPPRDMNSHWAKLTIPVALWMILKPMATMAYIEPTVKPVIIYWAICWEKSIIIIFYSSLP